MPKEQKPRTPMTSDDQTAASLLKLCRKKFDSPEHKTFAWQMGQRARMHPERGITVAQRDFLWDLVWKYRDVITNRFGAYQDLRRLLETARAFHETSEWRWEIRRLKRQKEAMEKAEQQA